MNFAWKKLIVATALLTATYSASGATTWPIKSWATGTKSTRLTQVLINAKDDDILELQNNLSVNADIEIRKRLTLRSADNKRYTITNRGYTYGVKIHPGGTLIMENVIYDCAGMNQIEDVFLLNPQTVSGSTTNVSRMILNNGASIRNAVLSSSTRNENAVIHVKQGAVLTIKSGAEIINCKNNSNPGKGGAICCDFGTVIMTGGTIAGCYAKGAGGAIHTDGTRVDSAGNYGINARGDIYISGGYITNNTCGAGQYGGAIYLGNSGPLLHITGTTVISNNFSGTGENSISDDVSTYLLQNAYANRLKLVDHDESNPSGFSYEGIKFTGNVGVRYPDVSEMSDPQHTRFGAIWEYFTGSQEEPRQFFWNGNNEYRGRLDGNALVWTSHVTHELPKDGDKIKGLIEAGELSPLYIELNADYEMTSAVNVPENYEIVIDLQGHNFICDFHVSNTTGRVVFRDSSVNKSGTVTGHRDSPYASAFYLEGGSYQMKPPPEWIAPNRVLIGNYCKDHPYMVAIKAWDADKSYSVADLTKVTLEDADYEVRDVTFDKNGVPDIPKITFSAGAWKHMQHNNLNHRVVVLAAPAETNKTTGAFIECEPKIVLFDSSATTGTQHYGREGEFEYLAASRGLIKLIHITMKAQGETYITNSIDTAYLRFPAAEFRATQRKNGEKLHINIVDALLSQLNFNRASGFTDNEVNTMLDTVSDNGLRKWENIVTGTSENEYLLSTASSDDGGLKLKVSLTNTEKVSRGDTGYSVLYDIRKFTNGNWLKVSELKENPTFEIDLLTENGGTKNASGFYRITTLIIPQAENSITNEIPSENIVGVLEVPSAFTNTLAAVPWVALPQDSLPGETPVSLDKVVDTAHLDDDDALQIVQNGLHRKWNWDKKAKHWKGAITVTKNAVQPASSASDEILERNSTVWVTRKNPDHKPFFLIGQYSNNPVELVISEGSAESAVCTLVPNPSMKSVRINDFNWGNNPIKGSSGDIIRIPNERNIPLNLTWNGNEWGRFVKVPGTRDSVWKNDETISAGTGFWYMRRGESFTVSLPIANIE